MEHNTAAYRGIQAGVLFLRLVQATAFLFAVILPIGSIMANQTVIAFVFIGFLSLILFAFIGVMQLVVWGLKKRVAPES